MRDLVIATLLFCLLLGGWLVFLTYADNQTEVLVSTLSQEILPLIEAEQWDESRKQMDTFRRDWYRFRSFCLYFLDSGTIREIDGGLAKSVKYVEAEDVSNSAGELNAIIEQLQYLMTNQKVTAANIF